MLDNITGTDIGDYYFGTRKYQKVSISLDDLGFVKGSTVFGVSINAPGYDKGIVIRPDSKYDTHDPNFFQDVVPVFETKQKVSFGENVAPFIRQYLVQDSHTPISNIDPLKNDNIDKEEHDERMIVFSHMCQ
jgi:hypothetical protein